MRLVALLTILAGIHSANSVCPTGWTAYVDDGSEGADSCVATTSYQSTKWSDAVAACASKYPGAHLLTFQASYPYSSTGIINRIITTIATGSIPLWVGCSQASSSPCKGCGWSWLDGTNASNLQCAGSGTCGQQRCGAWDNSAPDDGGGGAACPDGNVENACNIFIRWGGHLTGGVGDIKNVGSGQNFFSLCEYDVPSPSLTPTISGSATLSPTVTVTGSTSASSTLTPSCTPSFSTSPSDTPSTTSSKSLSASGSGSGTLTKTLTDTPTLSRTSTITETTSRTSSVTVSPSPSPTPLPPPSPTRTVSPSPTTSLTPSLTVTSSFSPTGTVTGSSTPTITASSSSSSTASKSPSTTSTDTSSPAGSPSSTPSKTFTVTGTVTPTTSATATDSATASATVTCTATASYSPTFSATPSPCPAGCSACVSTNCTACFAGSQWQLTYRADEARYACMPAVAVSPTFACGVAEESPAGTGVACPPLPTDVALSLSPLTQSGGGHPFIITTVPDGSISVTVGQSVASFPLDYGVTRRYNITLFVCVPQATAAFSGPGVTGSYSVCEAARHVDTSATLTIDLSPINKPPVFTVPFLSLSTPGVASAGDVLGFPLSLYAVNPNTVAPWNTLAFSVAGGRCGAPASQSSIPALPGLPFTVVPGNGSLVYTSAVCASSLGLQAWANPLFACATATNGGGLNASITITVTFTAVAARLSVFPTALSVTHYALGVSTSSATVSLFIGSQVGLTWDVWSGVGAPWLLGVRASDTALALNVNSSRLGSDWVTTPLSAANITLSTSDGLLTASVGVTLRLSIPAAAFSPPSLTQLVRQGGVADTSFSIASTGTDTLAYRAIVAAPWANVVQESTGTVAAGTSVSVALRANAASLAPSLYPTTITVQTNAPGGVLADPTAPASFATGSILTLPWELRVVQALLFPTEVSVTVTPGTPAVTTDFSLVNFAGSPILALFPQSDASSVSATAPSLTVRESQLGAFTLAAAYPTDANGAYSTPGQHTVNVSISCWKEATESDTVNVTAGSQVSPLARSGTFYVPITLPQITVYVTAMPGAPNATLSSVALTTPNATLVREPVVLWVSVRDAGSFSVPFDSAFGAVSLSFNASGGVTPLLLESVTPISINDSGNSSVVAYTLLPVAVGLVTIRVTVGGVAVPGGVVALNVLGPVCTGLLVLNPVSLTCMCASGMYKDKGTLACIPCPAGSYNPSPGNGSIAQCLPCPAGWYCERGSVEATATCPSGKGFDCSDGTLRTREGYWAPIPSNLSANVSWALYECDNPRACFSALVEPGAAQCAPGYTSSVCETCAPGYVGIGTFCVQCHYPGLSAVGVVAAPAMGLLVISLIIALVLEETGVKRVQAMWVPAHTNILVAELRALFDFVQVVTLQALIHAREYQWFVAGVLSLTGAGLGGGLGIQTWQPFLCILFSREPRTVHWAQLGVVLLTFPFAAVAATISFPLSRLVWHMKLESSTKGQLSGHSWWKRFGVALILMQWAVMMSVLRAAVSHPEGSDAAWIAAAVVILAVYGAGTVLTTLTVADQGRPFGVSLELVRLVTAGYKSNRSLFDILLLMRKCGLICIAVVVKNPLLGCLLALLTSVVVWVVAVIWKPVHKQMQLRLLQATILSLQLLMLLQASGHAQPAMMALLHALWLGLLCMLLSAALYSVGVVAYKLFHPPVSLVQNGLRLKSSKARESGKVAFIAAFRARGRTLVRDSDALAAPPPVGSMQSRTHRVGRAGGMPTPRQGQSEGKP